MKNEKGITLVALIITIIVLILITGAGISAGGKSLNDVKLKSFYTKLEIAQEGVNKIVNTNESYKDDHGNEVFLRNLGAEPTQEQKDFIEQTIGIPSTGFRYFTSNQLEKDLQIYGVGLNLLINFDESIIINPEGIRIGRNYYYKLENKKYTVSKDNNNDKNDKNVGTPDFNYNAYSYGSNSYIIEIMPINVGDINLGVVRFRKEGINYWNTADDNKCIVNDLGNYEIKYTDANNNSITKTIRIWKDPEEPDELLYEEVN